MTDFSKVKKKTKKGLGQPPAFEQTKGNLDKPEVAPIAPTPAAKKTKKVGRPKSNRTAKITTTLTPKFKKKLQLLSLNLGKDMGEIIEEAVEHWMKNK